MKVKKIVDNTTSRSDFNRAYKRYLESKGKIHCSYCGYHSGENYGKKNSYGGYAKPLKRYDKIKYPNWKLVSKNRKQWEKKPLKITIEPLLCSTNREYIEFNW